MEVHVAVSAAKGKSKVKRPRQLGDKLEDLRSELDSLTLSLEESEEEEPEENLRLQLDSLSSLASLLPRQEPQEPKELEDLEEAEEQKESEDVEEPEKSKEPARGQDGLGEVSRSKTVQAWHGDLLHNLRIASTPPIVSKSKFRDARKLFGVNCDNKVILRNPGYVGGYEDIVLLQFDPNFMSTEVVCRHPCCNNVNPAAAKSGKRDLYLCPQHQQVLKNNISDVLVENSVILKKAEPGHFAGYTSLISLLEGAFHDAKKFQTPQGKSLTVQEAILNVRNFLIITSTVLNPDEDNLGIALPPVVEVLKLILENPASAERLVACLIDLLHEVLSAFAVIYTWVSLALKSPGSQIGAGIGGGIFGTVVVLLSPWSWPVAVAVGMTCGGLIGNGIYKLSWEQRWQEKDGLKPNRQPRNKYPAYCFNGDAKGGLDMHFQFPAI